MMRSSDAAMDMTKIRHVLVRHQASSARTKAVRQLQIAVRCCVDKHPRFAALFADDDAKSAGAHASVHQRKSVGSVVPLNPTDCGWGADALVALDGSGSSVQLAVASKFVAGLPLAALSLAQSYLDRIGTDRDSSIIENQMALVYRSMGRPKDALLLYRKSTVGQIPAIRRIGMASGLITAIQLERLEESRMYARLLEQCSGRYAQEALEHVLRAYLRRNPSVATLAKPGFPNESVMHVACDITQTTYAN